MPRADLPARPSGLPDPARLKTCLAMLGRFPSDRMLPPAVATPTDEHLRLRAALDAALGDSEPS